MHQPYDPNHPYAGQPGQVPPAQPQGWGPPQQQGWGQPPQQQGWGQSPQQQGWGQPQAQLGFGAPAQPSHGYVDHDAPVSEASPEVRAKFIERTYVHLAGAIAVFTLLLTALVNLPGIESLIELMISTQASWAVVLGLFMAVSWVADRWSKNAVSLGMQYAGLGLYVVAEAVIFVPLVYIAMYFVGGGVILNAAVITLAMFAAMTAYVFISKKDFSFIKGALVVAGMAATGLVVSSLVFGFQLGNVFSVAMILLACGYILYYTSNVLHHYRPTQHVAAALALFSAVALLFWYVLRLFMSRR